MRYCVVDDLPAITNNANSTLSNVNIEFKYQKCRQNKILTLYAPKEAWVVRDKKLERVSLVVLWSLWRIASDRYDKDGPSNNAGSSDGVLATETPTDWDVQLRARRFLNLKSNRFPHVNRKFYHIPYQTIRLKKVLSFYLLSNNFEFHCYQCHLNRRKQ